MRAPVIVFTYCRKDHTDRLLNSLNECTEAELTDLYIFSDAAKNESKRQEVEEVRTLLEDFSQRSKYKNVFIQYADKNMGLANSIISGVTRIIDLYGSAIIVEDDLVVSRDFVKFMNDALNYYEKDDSIGAISGFTYPISALKKYTHDVYLSTTGNSWGWATWKRVWNDVDWTVGDYPEFKESISQRKKFNKIQTGISNMLDSQMSGEIDSWAVRWDYHLFRHDLATVYPKISRVRNDGFDDTGTHCTSDSQLREMSEEKEADYLLEDVCRNKKIMYQTANYGKVSLIKKVKNKVLRKWKKIK